MDSRRNREKSGDDRMNQAFVVDAHPDFRHVGRRSASPSEKAPKQALRCEGPARHDRAPDRSRFLTKQPQWTSRLDVALLTRCTSVLLLFACDPKPPVTPSYFTASRPADAPPPCEETLACYARCIPLVDECMLRCDQCGASSEVARARAVSNCAAIHACADQACTEQQCAPQLAGCTARRAGGPPVIDTFCPTADLVQ